MQANEKICIKDVSHYYDGKLDAVKDINVTIQQGEFICVLGPSGCGKSTLLNIIAGFIRPTKGTILVGDREISKPDWNRGVVFQTPVLYPWYSVWDNIAFGLKCRKVSKAEIKQTVDEYIRLVGLEEFANAKTYELSGGMQQRVALARVLVNSPEIVLMDEPFGALDSLTRMNMQSMVRQIWEETGNTFFMITHDVDEALRLGSRILIMSERPGKIVKTVIPQFDLKGTVEDAEKIVKYNQLKKEILSIINPGHAEIYADI